MGCKQPTLLAGTALDVLFANAGVANGAEEILPDVATEDFVRTLTTNALSLLRVIEALAELVTPSGTIDAVSRSKLAARQHRNCPTNGG